ncbi:hypothetical protein EAG_13810 [Camponotus floridanus]|uniref:Uncharacterized protein n=1 Tax=Camponotus floridanus TaxID=104421 RepID=E2AVN4_CAMFO|nr:hypothetical protein EAG_13810 [Camponotus floridanus]
MVIIFEHKPSTIQHNQWTLWDIKKKHFAHARVEENWFSEVRNAVTMCRDHYVRIWAIYDISSRYSSGCKISVSQLLANLKKKTKMNEWRSFDFFNIFTQVTLSPRTFSLFFSAFSFLSTAIPADQPWFCSENLEPLSEIKLINGDMLERGCSHAYNPRTCVSYCRVSEGIEIEEIRRGIMIVPLEIQLPSVSRASAAEKKQRLPENEERAGVEFSRSLLEIKLINNALKKNLVALIRISVDSTTGETLARAKPSVNNPKLTADLLVNVNSSIVTEPQMHTRSSRNTSFMNDSIARESQALIAFSINPLALHEMKLINSDARRGCSSNAHNQRASVLFLALLLFWKTLEIQPENTNQIRFDRELAPSDRLIGDQTLILIAVSFRYSCTVLHFER